MDLLPPEPPDYWKFKLVAGAAAFAGVTGGLWVLDSDLTTAGGIAWAVVGAVMVLASIAGFVYYWRSV